MHPPSSSTPPRLRIRPSLFPYPQNHSPVLPVKSWQEEQWPQAMVSVLTHPGMSGPVFSLYVLSLPKRPLTSDRRPPCVDSLRRVRRHPLRLRYRCHCGHPNDEGLVVRLRKIQRHHRGMRHHLIPAVPRRLHLVCWHVLRCSTRSSCGRFRG